MLGIRVGSIALVVLVANGACTAFTSATPDPDAGAASTTDAAATSGGASDASAGGSSGSADPDSGAATDGGGGELDSAPPQPLADLERANWPMPNSTASGLPHPPAYQVDAGVVTDLVTGLVWQQASSAAAMGYPAALSSCEALELGGRSDWRLPTATELFSIVDLGASDPSVSSEFPNIPVGGAGWFWTSTLLKPPGAEESMHWAIQFRAGGGYSGSWPVGTACSVRCVAGAAPPAQPRIVPVSTGIVKDTYTGLTWMAQAIAGPFDYVGAHDACAAVTLGSGAWRVPSMKELETIVDRRRYSPAIDEGFVGASAVKLWSSSLLTDYSGSAWRVDLELGHAERVNDTVEASVQCVQ